MSNKWGWVIINIIMGKNIFLDKINKAIAILLVVVLFSSFLYVNTVAENEWADEKITQEALTEAIPVEELAEEKEAGSSYARGYANVLDGDTLIVSLFVNTKNHIWTESSMGEALKNLDVALKYITNEAATYGKTVSFLYDFNSNPNLKYRTWVNFEADDASFEDKVDDRIGFFVDRVIDYEGLQIKYDVDNVFTILYFNDTGRSYAICYDGTDIPEETLIMFSDGNPAVYAHEILHLFGAHDYYSNGEYTKETVEYVKSAYPEDIMLKTDFSNGKILGSVGRLTAYHLGWENEAPGIYEYSELIR